MKIILAGYNIETESMGTSTQKPTPEIFSAAYARISRSPKDIVSLRRQARQDLLKARQSNKKIIFAMGHHSVAEHAVFNFDIIGVSRLALEELEKLRLSSYTEKSQRYVLLTGDYHLPAEISDSQKKNIYSAMIKKQNDFYLKSFNTIKLLVQKKHPHLTSDKEGIHDLENLAKEDARYILSLATEGQVGMTINARNLEHLFRRLAMSKYEEVRQIGQNMFKLVEPIAPSIILFPQPSPFEKEVYTTFLDKIDQPMDSNLNLNEPEIIECTPNTDEVILASFFALKNNISYSLSLELVKRMAKSEKETIFKELFSRMEFFDRPPRAFELAEIFFQAVVSAANYAQLKRHRMATIIAGDYQIQFGVTIPERMVEAGLEREFCQIIEETHEVYSRLKNDCLQGADYILTNSHRRLVQVKMNLREFYHFVRLRDDIHAQWDIKSLTHKLIAKIIPIMPYAAMLLCGKSDYVKTYRAIYGHNPEFLI